MADSSGYTSAGGGSVSLSLGEAGADEKKYWGLYKCKRAYQDYIGNKRDEIAEQQKARRYRHGVHWTDDQIKILNRRKQPIVTYNEVGRKANATVGQIVRLRLDPKAYPRTPQHQKGADLATAALRYVMDEADFKSKEPQVADMAYVNGISGLELELIQGDHGDPEIALNLIDDDGFFYDPRSFALDFNDAQYLGQAKWVDEDVIADQFGEEFAYSGYTGSDSDLTTNSDKDNKWFFTRGNRKMIRLVDLWYRKDHKWYWSIFTGAKILQEGESPFADEKGKQFCKFIMFSAASDHEGDRYGPIRNLIPINDEINMRRSKALHELNSRRIIAEKGAFDDLERMRLEASKPDGIILKNPSTEVAFDDPSKQLIITGQMEMLKEASIRLESYGPNAALTGDSTNLSQSGRAIQLRQQAGLAELGPYFSAYKAWKIALYRAVWNTAQAHWKAERWIRVTDDQGLAQYVQLNAMQVDPMTGMPTLVNAIGSLDVDIILDEGPDTVTMMQDVYETLGDIVPSIAKFVPPGVATALVSILVQNSPLPEDAKKQLRDAAQQPAPPPPEMLKLQAEQQSKQQELQFKQQSAGLDAQIAQQRTQGELQLKREIAAADMDLERQKAENQMSLDRQKAAHEVDKTHADILLKTHMHRHDMEMSKEKMGMERDKVAAVSKAAQPQSAVMVEALGKLSEPRASEQELVKVLSALAGEIGNMNKPKNKKVRKNKDGTFDVIGT